MSQTSSGNLPIGEIAHIVAEELGGPRGSADWGPRQRNEPENLLLLCPNHHKEIDNHPEVWPVERLKKLKVEHEKWVRETLDKHAFAKQEPRKKEQSRGAEERIEAAEYCESIGDVWRAAEIYEQLASRLRVDGNAKVATEMDRRAKKCRSAAAQMMRDGWGESDEADTSGASDLRPVISKDTEDRYQVQQLHSVQAVVLHPSGKYVAWSTMEGWAPIFDIDNHSVVSEIQGSATRNPNGGISAYNPIDFSPDGNLLAIGHHNGYKEGDGTIDVFDWRTRRLLKSLKGPAVGVLDLRFDPSGTFLVGSFFKQCTKIWATSNWEQTLEIHETGRLSVSSECQHVAITSTNNGAMRVFYPKLLDWWDVEESNYGTPSITADGTLLAVPHDTDFHIWSVRERCRLSPVQPRYPDFNKIDYGRWLSLRQLNDLQFTLSGEKLGMSWSCGAAVYDCRSGQVIFALEDDSFTAAPSISFDSKGRRFAACDINPPLHILNTASGEVEIVIDYGA